VRRSSSVALASAAVVRYLAIAVHHPVREVVDFGATAPVANMTSCVVIRTGADFSVAGTGATPSILEPVPTTSSRGTVGVKTNSDIDFSPCSCRNLHPADTGKRNLTAAHNHA
jgi:hypothetical protein